MLLHMEAIGKGGLLGTTSTGVSVRKAWNTGKSAHGPWRLSKTPELTLACLARYFTCLGLRSLAAR